MSNNLNLNVAPPQRRPQMGRQQDQNQQQNMLNQAAGQAIQQAGSSFADRAQGYMTDITTTASNIMQDPNRRNQIKEDILGAGEVDKKVWDLIRDVPQVPTPCCWILAFINIFFPGWGTMMSSCFGGGCSKTQFAIGILQFSLGWILVGYPLSWYWAYLIVKKSLAASDDEEEGSQAQGGSSNIIAPPQAPHQRFDDSGYS